MIKNYKLLFIIQERVRQEFDDVIKSNDGQIGITELQKLSYLERCIKEALRLYPSVPFISRNITDDMQLSNLFLYFFHFF